MLDSKYGILVNDDIKLHRQYFEEMTALLGIQVIYKAPRVDKHYTLTSEIDSNYYEPKLVGCIFEEHPTQQTLKKLGWVSELQQEVSIISVPYDLEHLQRGALFIVPSGLDNGKGKVFRVNKLYTTMIYPASITCELVPEFENTLNKSDTIDFENRNFTLLREVDS